MTELSHALCWDFMGGPHRIEPHDWKSRALSAEARIREAVEVLREKPPADWHPQLDSDLFAMFVRRKITEALAILTRDPVPETPEVTP